MNVFDEMGIYWTEIADKNQTERQLDFLKSQLNQENYILDLACGTGRHTIGLNNEGYGIVGLDISIKLLKIAKQRAQDIDLVRGDMQCLPFKSEVFNAVISMDTSIGYLPSEREDVKSLTEVHRVLCKTCTLVIDVFNRTSLKSKYSMKNQTPKWHEYPTFRLLQKRNVNDDGDLLCDLWTVKDKVNGKEQVFEHTVRLYAPTQLTKILEESGFKIDQFFGDYERQEYSDESPRLIVLACTK